MVKGRWGVIQKGDSTSQGMMVKCPDGFIRDPDNLLHAPDDLLVPGISHTVFELGYT